MLNKKIHADFIKQREELLKEPDSQTKLRAAIDSKFAGKLETIPNLCWEFGLAYSVKRADALEVFSTLKQDPQFLFNMLIDITAVDWLDQRDDRFEVVYQLLSLPFLHRVCLKIAVPEEKPEVDSVLKLWPGANFMEREVWDMFGIVFEGHGDLRRILLYDEFVGHPLRKDYPIRGKQPRVALRVPELRNTSDDMHRDELIALPVRQRSKNGNPKGADV